MSELSSIRDELVDEARGLSFTYNHLISTATGHCEYGIADIHSRGLIVLMADYIERYRQESNHRPLPCQDVSLITSINNNLQ